MTKYEFDVTIIDKNGNSLTFKAKNCEVKKSPIAWIGMTRKITETIICDEFKVTTKRGKKK